MKSESEQFCENLDIRKSLSLVLMKCNLSPIARNEIQMLWAEYTEAIDKYIAEVEKRFFEVKKENNLKILDTIDDTFDK